MSFAHNGSFKLQIQQSIPLWLSHRVFHFFFLFDKASVSFGVFPFEDNITSFDEVYLNSRSESYMSMGLFISPISPKEIYSISSPAIIFTVKSTFEFPRRGEAGVKSSSTDVVGILPWTRTTRLLVAGL